MTGMSRPRRWLVCRILFVLVTNSTATVAFSSAELPSFNSIVRSIEDVCNDAHHYYFCGRPRGILCTVGLKGTKNSDEKSIQNTSKSEGHPSVLCLSDRRACIASIAFGTGAIAVAKGANSHDIGDNYSSEAKTPNDSPTIISLPLEPASGGTFCVRCTVFGIEESKGTNLSQSSEYASDFRVYRAIVDTGSPYLVFPSSSLSYDLGKSNRFMDFFRITSFLGDDQRVPLWSNSEYSSTEEIYGEVKGEITWKKAQYQFRDPRLRILQSSPNSMSSLGVVGVLDEALTKEATGGGIVEPYALLGLIRNNNPNADKERFPEPRPTFFEQECISNNDFDHQEKQYKVQSFSMNGPLHELTLSTGSLIAATTPSMPLVDLREFGDFVDHYAVLVDSVSFDGVTVTSKLLKEATGASTDRHIVAVFDTGLTGGLLIRPFWNAVQQIIRTRNKTSSSDVETSDFQSVAVSIKGSQTQQIVDSILRETSNKRLPPSSLCNISSNVETNPHSFYVSPIDLDWFDDELAAPFVIILGQTFLRQGVLTIDMNQRLATFTKQQ